MNLDKEDTTLLHISWNNINSGSTAVANYILRHELPDVIITSQEDVIPAALVCNATKIPLCIAHLTSKQNGIIVECMPKVGRPIVSGVYHQSPLPTIMIFSTMIDNTTNVDDLVSYYAKRGHNVNTSCIYSRKTVTNKPDYNWVKLTQSAKYRFPWQE